MIIFPFLFVNHKPCRYFPDVDVHEVEENYNGGRKVKYTHIANLWVYLDFRYNCLNLEGELKYGSMHQQCNPLQGSLCSIFLLLLFLNVMTLFSTKSALGRNPSYMAKSLTIS